MGGLWEKVSRAFTFIWAAIRMAFRDKDIFIPSLMSVAAGAAYVVVIFLALNASGNLWLIGVERSDIEGLKEVGRTLEKTPAQLTQERMEAEGARADAGDKAMQEAVERGEEPEAAGARVAAAQKARAQAPRDGDAQPAAEKDRTRQYAQVAFGILVFFGLLFITYFFTAMTIQLVHAHLMGRDARLGEAFVIAAKHIAGIALLAGVSIAVEILAGLFRSKRGKETFISRAIREVWKVATLLALPAIVIDDLSLWKGMKRAKEIVTKNLLIVAIGQIGVSLVGNLIGFVGVAAGVVVGIYTSSVLAAPLYVPVAAGGIIIVVTMAFVSYVKVAYYTCLYINAVETARVGKRVLPLGPLAAALE